MSHFYFLLACSILLKIHTYIYIILVTVEKTNFNQYIHLIINKDMQMITLK